jgi:hypothetical protein
MKKLCEAGEVVNHGASHGHIPRGDGPTTMKMTSTSSTSRTGRETDTVKRCFIFYTLLFSQCVQLKKLNLEAKNALER